MTSNLPANIQSQVAHDTNQSPLRSLAIICDFDGTITRDDLAVSMLTAYAVGDWEYWYHQYLDGKMPLEESLKHQFESLRATKRQLMDYVDTNAKIRPGFGAFVEFCREKDTQLVIASVGLDFYIKAVLDKAGISHPELVCGRARFGRSRLRITYPDVNSDGSLQGMDIKEWTVERLRKDFNAVAYIGDGFPDFPAASRCDAIFARANLASKCAENNIPYVPFDNFYDVMAGLEKTPVEIGS